MIIVIDTSAAAEIILQRSNGRKLHNGIDIADWVISPQLFISEITNVFWKYHNFYDMPINDCKKYIELSLKLPDDFFNEEELYREAFSLACLTKMPVYDMFFLVLTRRNDGFLMTMDKKLKKIAEKHDLKVF